MRIALVAPYSLDVPGGVATHILGLAKWLARRGHDPYVVAPGLERTDAEIPTVLLGRAVGFSFNGSIARLAVFPGQQRLVRSVLATADLVHVHEPLTPGAAFVAARVDRPLTVTHHAAFTPGPLQPLLRLRASCLPRNRVSLAVSIAAAQTARSATGVTPRVVSNAVELPGLLSPRAGRPMVLFVGRDEPRKGFALFAQLARCGIDADFVAAGPCRSTPGIQVLGAVSDAERGRLLAGASVLVAPNLGGESFGLVVIEALAHGAAVVASDLPAFRAVVDDPRVIRFFPRGDLASAAEAVRAMLADRPDPEQARAAVSRYSWDEVGPSILRAYEMAADRAYAVDKPE